MLILKIMNKFGGNLNNRKKFFFLRYNKKDMNIIKTIAELSHVQETFV